MEAGEVSVHPDDSIEQLQQVMTSTGWGQVPVTDPESGEVIGIVTRTDLLKTLAGREEQMQERPTWRKSLKPFFHPQFWRCCRSFLLRRTLAARLPISWAAL
jgi:CBS domain containing-hemolysin-like protein